MGGNEARAGRLVSNARPGTVVRTPCREGRILLFLIPPIMSTAVFTYGSLMFPRVWERVVQGGYRSAEAVL